MEIGDRIQVEINGGTTGVTLGDPNGATIGIGAGASMSVGGEIIADLGTHWRVKLDMSVGGQNIINVPK